MHLYHLSKSNISGEVFLPRVPQSSMEDEGSKAKRICFSTSIDGALKALPKVRDADEYFVFEPDQSKGLAKIYYPTTKQVPDCKVTNEVWVKKPVKMKLVGKIKVVETFLGYIDKLPEDKYTFADGEEDWVDHFTWKFL